MRTFTLERRKDETGISGTGIVLEGIEFSDGRVSVRWTGSLKSTGSYESLTDFLSIHVLSHPGNSSIIRFSDGSVLGQNQHGQLVAPRRVCRKHWPGQSSCPRDSVFCVHPDCLVLIFE